ncbi:MAG: nickel-dependent lactate racemase [Candidatus Eisenbacteria bacterium]|nr:nickel-dependent lactate racemase [Candidatus Eisenbacteria bacterium]
MTPDPRALVQLAYGRGVIPFRFDPDRFDLLEPDSGTSAAREVGDDQALLAALESPIDSAPLSELIRPHDHVLVVVPDATRASGSARVTTLLRSHLAALGVTDDRIRILIGAGTHRAPRAEEVLAIVGPEIAERLTIEAHDAFDDRQLVAVGDTPRGTPVELNRRLTQADRVILVGAIGFHYFAGFSGGRKGILPACASDRSIQANHLLGFDRATLSKAPGVETARLDGNPVSEDMEDAARLLPPTYLLNTVLDDRGSIAALYAGHWYGAHRRGCAEYLAAHSVVVREQRPIVIASVGGAPRDLNLIQSHKALEHARVVLRDGGDLILLAECADGLGRADFLDWFVPGGAEATAAKLVDHYRINGQTAWGIRWKAERYRVHLISALPEEWVRRTGMRPARDLAQALDSCGHGRGYIIPHGLGTLPLPSDPASHPDRPSALR